MSILIKNATVLSCNTLAKNVNIFIEEDCINYIGEKDDFKADTVLNGNNRVVMPGLVNSHTHSSMTLLRNYADGLPLEEWLFTKIFPVEDKMSPTDAYHGTELAILEMLASGTTTFNDMYTWQFMDNIAKAVSESGIRANLTVGLLSGNTNGFETDERLNKNIELYKKFHGSEKGHIRIGFGLHSVYTCTPEYLKYCGEAAHSLGAMCHIHLSETLTENEGCMAKYQKTPTVLMNEAGVLDGPCVAAHCVHLNDNDREILAEKGVSIALCPSSNLKLKSGIANIPAMGSLNLTVGTDGASSNNNLNMFEEMHLAALLSAFPAERVLSAATINGAAALDFENIGEVREGFKADLIIVDTDKPHHVPMHDLRAAMVYSAQGSDVETTIVDGKILYHKGEFKTADYERIKYDVQKSKNRLFNG